MAARTDPHSPLNLVTEDYEYVYSYDSRQPGCLVGIAQTDWWQDICRNRANIHDQGQCDHCGAWLRYIAILKHTPTGQYIEVGETCLGNRFDRASADFHALRKTAELDRKQQRILAEWDDFIQTHTHIDVTDKTDTLIASNVEVPWSALFESTNPFTIDVLSRGRQYGNLSDRQLNAVVRSFLQDIERLLAPVVPEPTWLPVPELKAYIIEGVVLTEKWQASDFAPHGVHKCLVQVDVEGGSYKLWGSVPKSLEAAWRQPDCSCEAPNDVCPKQHIGGYIGGLVKGSKVRFVANIEPSRNDPTFGIFKRPRSGVIL